MAVRKARLSVVILVVAWFASCSFSKDVGLAEAEVQSFRVAFEAGQFESIYDGSDDEFKRRASKAQLVSMLDGMHETLGKVTEYRRTASQVKYLSSGVLVTLAYETKFSNGSAMEHFVYRISDDGPKLAGYHVSNTRLSDEDEQSNSTI